MKAKRRFMKTPHCDDEDEEMDRRISQVAFVAYQQAKMKGIPAARYDAEKKAAYLLYPDGHREYVDKPPEKVPASAGLAPQNQVQWEQKFTREKGRTTMTYTSAQANKLLKKLNDERAALQDLRDGHPDNPEVHVESDEHGESFFSRMRDRFRR